MDTSLDLARQFLRDLLSNGPKYGAGLKVQLAQAFDRASDVPFRHLEKRFGKFSAFLAANSDLVEVLRPDSVGDVTVRLKTSPHADDGTRFSRLPMDLWHAFTNPDRRRRRYYNRATGRVVHFLLDPETDLDRRLAAEVLADKNNYVEVECLSTFRQASWMDEFLDSVSIPAHIRATCAHLAKVPYSSSVNSAFTVALREYGSAYKHFRASRVLEAVKEWAQRCGIDPVLDMFASAASDARPPAATTAELISAPATEEHASDLDMRKRLHALIDLLDEQELHHVLVPLSYISRLAKKHQ